MGWYADIINCDSSYALEIRRGDYDEQRSVAPETKGVTVQLAATLDLGCEISVGIVRRE
jgi:hypothetical protein